MIRYLLLATNEYFKATFRSLSKQQSKYPFNLILSANLVKIENNKIIYSDSLFIVLIASFLKKNVKMARLKIALAIFIYC